MLTETGKLPGGAGDWREGKSRGWGVGIGVGIVEVAHDNDVHLYSAVSPLLYS